jgi:hypothetical protein
VPGPQDQRTGCAQAGQGGHCGLDVAVGDVAEDAACHHYLGGYRAGAGIGNPGVGLQHLDAVQPSRLRRLPCERDVARVQLDQPSAHVASARMPGQHADHVPALPGAETDQANDPGGCTFELGALVPLHEFPAPRKQGAWIVVVPVPFHPVTPRHSGTLQSAAGRHQSSGAWSSAVSVRIRHPLLGLFVPWVTRHEGGSLFGRAAHLVPQRVADYGSVAPEPRVGAEAIKEGVQRVQQDAQVR